MAILIDTSALFAASYSKDKNHKYAQQTFLNIKNELKIVTSAALLELFQISVVRIHYDRAIETFAVTRNSFHVETLIMGDMLRMEGIMRQYRDAELDYTDVSMIAVAERLNITRVFTFDRRDFSIVHPLHCDYLQLLP